MLQERLKKFTDIDAKAKVERHVRRRIIGTSLRRTIVVLLVFLILGIVFAGIAYKAPIRNSVIGDYTPPTSRDKMEPYSRARWFLHDAHTAELTVDLAWYNRSKAAPPQSIADLEKAGFCPFTFVDEKGSAIEILDSGKVTGPFGIALTVADGNLGGFVSLRSMQDISLLNRRWLESKEETITIDPAKETSIYAQFLPDKPQLSEVYVCFLADVWDTAVSRYVAIYHKSPENINVLLDGVGLAANPNCVWPLDGRTGGVTCEGGVIDGKIVYWRVTLANGGTHGQARYYDSYDASFDDPETPPNISTKDGLSPVADPDMIGGNHVVMFSPSIMKKLLDGARTSNGSAESQN